MSNVEHPQHYGGKNNPYEAIKVIEAWALSFHLGNTIKYISRVGKKAGESALDDLRKARWYLNRAIKRLEAEAPSSRWRVVELSDTYRIISPEGNFWSVEKRWKEAAAATRWTEDFHRYLIGVLQTLSDQD